MSETIVPSTATTTLDKPKSIPTSFKHPLDPLTPDEIAAVSLSVRHYIASQSDIKAIKFITCYLLPPPKRAVLAQLGIPLEPGAKAEPAVGIVRQAEVDFLDIVNGHNYNVILSLKNAEWTVDTLERLAEGVQPQISVEELVAAEGVVRKDPRVQKYAKTVGVEPHQIYCDGWSIGYDERFPQARRIQQALVFARYSEHENLYAHPMDFIPVIDANAEEVLAIEFPPHYKAGPNGPVLSSNLHKLPELTDDPLAQSGRDRIPPPQKAFEFLPDLMAETEKDYKPRDDVKPLHVVQPEGVSFKMDGNELEWQNWKMHISFTHREGIALSTITYNDHGEIRPVIYRLSIAEMVVPYGAPEHPHPRKFAFDTGEYGMGTMANELSLGCDCLGQIHYLPGSYVAHDGHAIVIKNVICIHEEDSGVLWKHTDYRPGGRSQTVRRRRLVVSMVCTLANYEYIWNYHFYQDGTIELEIRLTGILQVYVGADGEPNKYGTTIAPNVNAHYHQHLFSLRVDPMIDGIKNSVVESDVLPLAADDPVNFAGNGFTATETVLKESSWRDWDASKERRWKIVNPSKKHYATGKNVGYSIGLKDGITPLMARPTSWVGTRAAFANHPMWVCKSEEDAKGVRMWPAGKYVPQTRTLPKDSLQAWVDKKDNVENEEILVYATIGATHIPRPEDWPVMPAEVLHVTLKPNSFFEKNPSMDVPGTKDAKSVAAFTNGHVNGNTNGHTNGCCN